MAIATWADLQAAIANWLDRSDVAARIPEFIALAEADLSRRLRVPQMQARAEHVCSGGAARVPYPEDARQLSAVMARHGGRVMELEQRPLTALVSMYGDGAGAPVAYALADEQIWLFPAPFDGTVIEIVYYRDIPHLSDSRPTNWLLSSAPDLYLMASLLQAEFFGWNDQRLPIIKDRVDEIVAEMNLEGVKKARGSALRMRPQRVY